MDHGQAKIGTNIDNKYDEDSIKEVRFEIDIKNKHHGINRTEDTYNTCPAGTECKAGAKIASPKNPHPMECEHRPAGLMSGPGEKKPAMRKLMMAGHRA